MHHVGVMPVRLVDSVMQLYTFGLSCIM